MVAKFKSFWAKLRNFLNHAADEAEEPVTALTKPLVNFSASSARIALKNDYRMRVLKDSFHTSKNSIFMPFDVYFYQTCCSVHGNDSIQSDQWHFQFARCVR